MKMTILKIVGVVAVMCSALLAGCSDRPRDAVIDNGNFVVWHVQNCAHPQEGKYEVWVRDGSTIGWRFITDQNLKEGDVLQITKAR